MPEPLTSDGRIVRLLCLGLCLIAGALLLLHSLQHWNDALAMAWLVAWTDAFVLAFTLLISIRMATHSGSRQRQFSIAFLLWVTALIAVYLGVARMLLQVYFESGSEWDSRFTDLGSVDFLLPTFAGLVMAVVLTFPIIIMAADLLIRLACWFVRPRKPRTGGDILSFIHNYPTIREHFRTKWHKICASRFASC